MKRSYSTDLTDAEWGCLKLHVRGRKRHLLVDSEGLVLLRPRSIAQRSPTQDGLKLLLESGRTEAVNLKHLWLEVGYEGRGKRWAEEVSVLRASRSSAVPKKADPREGGNDLGRRMGQRRCEARLGEAADAP